MDYSKYQFSFGQYYRKEVVWIKFSYSENLKNDLRKRFPSAKWSKGHKAWYLPDLPSIRKQLNLPAKEIKIPDEICQPNKIALQNFINTLNLKAYSKSTVRLYVSEFEHLLNKDSKIISSIALKNTM